MPRVFSFFSCIVAWKHVHANLVSHKDRGSSIYIQIDTVESVARSYQILMVQEDRVHRDEIEIQARAEPMRKRVGHATHTWP